MRLEAQIPAVFIFITRDRWTSKRTERACEQARPLQTLDNIYIVLTSEKLDLRSFPCLQVIMCVRAVSLHDHDVLQKLGQTNDN